MNRRLKAGMVGGGRDAFIGGVHRMAMRLDGKIELVAGAFSSNPKKAKLSGEDLLLDPTASLCGLPHHGCGRRPIASPANGSTSFRL